MKSRSSLSVKDREKALAMCLVAERDMRDELFALKSFRYPDSLLPYITSSLEHCKAIINLRVPMDEATTFPLAPTWSQEDLPIDDEWEMSGRGPCTRSCNSFTLLRSGALLFGCFFVLTCCLAIPCFALS